MMQGTGPAVCLGNDVDTDLIIAGRYLRTKDRSVWAEHVLEDLDPALAPRIRGAIIVAGRNMGCGSSREQAVVALREAGVVGIVAESFARIFFRNAVNVGLPVIEASVACTDGAHVAFDLDSGWVEVDGVRRPARPLSPRMVTILLAGGLVPYWRSCR